MLNIADDHADDTVPSNSASVNFVQPMHNEELLHECYHIYHVRVLLLPLCKCGLRLHSAQIFERDVNLKPRESVFELDDGDARRDDLGVTVGCQFRVFEPPSCLVEQALVGVPRGHVHNSFSTVVVSIGDIYQIHISRGQVETCRERAKAQDTSVLLRKPALAHGAVDTIDQPITLFVLEGLGCDEVVEVEDLVVKPSIALVQKSHYEA